jgi:hypothetical protein
MAMYQRIHDRIQGGVKYICAAQKANGEMPTYWSTSSQMTLPRYVQSPFITGLVILALRNIQDAPAQEIEDSGLRYLKTKRKEDGFFSFLDDGIDVDLDDTCLLNWLLQQHQSVGRLFQALAERIADLPRRDGLYYTWIRKKCDEGNDLDPCVNINVLRFLAANDLDCGALVQALRRVLFDRTFINGTLYYMSGFAFPFLLYTLPPKLQKLIIVSRDEEVFIWDSLRKKTILSPIDAAMKLFILSSASIARRPDATVVGELLHFEKQRGVWPAWAVFRAFNFWGSAELTTALALQALHRFSCSFSK